MHGETVKLIPEFAWTSEEITKFLSG